MEKTAPRQVLSLSAAFDRPHRTQPSRSSKRAECKRTESLDFRMRPSYRRERDLEERGTESPASRVHSKNELRVTVQLVLASSCSPPTPSALQLSNTFKQCCFSPPLPRSLRRSRSRQVRPPFPLPRVQGGLGLACAQLVCLPPKSTGADLSSLSSFDLKQLNSRFNSYVIPRLLGR